jgi:hypothetical protein
VLADFLDLEDDALEDKLQSILKLSRREAVDLRVQLKRHRFTAAAVGVGMLAGFPAATAPGAAAADPATRPVGAMADHVFASSAPAQTTISIDAIARMDAIITATPPVVVPADEWPRKPRSVPSARAAGAPAPQAATEVVPEPVAQPAPELPTEIGDAVRYERDPDLELPPGVEIGSALVIER